MRLEWTPAEATQSENEQALRRGTIDFLPVGVYTDARKREFHVSQPWWASDLVALVRRDSPIRNEADLNGLKISVAMSAVYAVESRLNKANLHARPSIGAVVSAMCDNEDDAAILQTVHLRDLLLALPPSCNDVPLQAVDTRMEVQFSLISRRESAGVVESLRKAIDDLTLDGTLEALAARHPLVSASQAGNLASVLRSTQERRMTRYSWEMFGAVLVLGGLVFVWQQGSRRRLGRLNEELSKSRLTLETRIAELKTVFETLNEGVFVSDLAGDLIFWNRAAAGILEIEEYQIARPLATFASDFELVADDFAVVPFDRWPLSRIIRGEVLKNVELVMRNRSTGETRLLLFSGSLARDASGKPLMAVVHTRDETERRLAETVARRQDHLLRILSDTTTDCIYIKDRDSRYLYANPATLRAMGRSRAEVVGQSNSSLLSNPVGSSDVAANDRRVMESATTETMEEVLTFHDVTRTYLTTKTVWKDDSGVIGGVVGISRDITERKRIERQALEWQRAFENADVAITLSEIQGRTFRSVNVAFASERGYVPEELAGRAISTIYPEREWSRLLEFDSIANEQQHVRFESVNVRKDGTEFPVLVDTTMIKEGHDGVVSRVTFSFDLTEVKRSHDEIMRLNSELEERVRSRTLELESANKDLEAFAYSVSHDLRAPLRGIDGWCLALVEDYGPSLDAQAHKYLGRVRSEAQRMGTLIDELLGLSRLNRSHMKAEPVELTELAQRIAARLSESNSLRHLAFSIQPGLSAVGDRALLDIALTNLLDNAVKFTSRRNDASIEFGQNEVEGKLVFYVRDNGAGFDMAHASKLFGVFQRLHRQADFPGTGIGLATVQRIVKRHGGKIWAEAAPQTGATFYFTIGTDRES